jgi:branched-chain amino acid transport system permease protein
MLETLPQILAFGLVFGGVYALASLGLGLAWGIMHVINFAHGEWIMISMYFTYWLTILFGLDPYFVMPINIALGALIGALTQRHLVEPVLKGGATATILSTLGLSSILIGITQAIWKSTPRNTPNVYVETSLGIGPVRLSLAHLLAFAISIIAITAIYSFFKSALTGKAILATSDLIGDPEVAGLVGIDAAKMRVLTLILAGASTGVAGTLIGTFYYVYPYVGLTWSLICFVVVVLGGLGSFKGLLIAGLIIGVLEGLGSLIFGSAYGYILVYAAFLMILYLRPRGLMGRRA